MKQRGRNAVFTCSADFTMHGQRFAVCINGKWDTELPLCIGRIKIGLKILFLFLSLFFCSY